MLKTIPFDKVKIDLFLIEYTFSGDGTTEKLNAINKFFEGLGKYKQIHRSRRISCIKITRTANILFSYTFLSSVKK